MKTLVVLGAMILAATNALADGFDTAILTLLIKNSSHLKMEFDSQSKIPAGTQLQYKRDGFARFLAIELTTTSSSDRNPLIPEEYKRVFATCNQLSRESSNCIATIERIEAISSGRLLGTITIKFGLQSKYDNNGNFIEEVILGDKVVIQ